MPAQATTLPTHAPADFSNAASLPDEDRTPLLVMTTLGRERCCDPSQLHSHTLDVPGSFKIYKQNNVLPSSRPADSHNLIEQIPVRPEFMRANVRGFAQGFFFGGHGREHEQWYFLPRNNPCDRRPPLRDEGARSGPRPHITGTPVGGFGKPRAAKEWCVEFGASDLLCPRNFMV